MLVVACCASGPAPASADFRLCNNTSSRVGIALGYKDAEGWTTEGWWNISSRSCETLLRGTLVARYYYIYAIDYDRGGEWSGQAFMCSRDKEFTIRGTEDCLARGYDRTGYFEVDTGEQRAWTVQLTDANEQPAQQRVPGLPGPVGRVAAFRVCPIARRVVRLRRSGLPPAPPPRLEVSHEASSPYQDSRDPGTCLFGSRDDPPPVRGRRRPVPHQHEPHPHDKMRELVATIRNVEMQLWPADRHPGRSAGAEAPARRLRRGRGPAPERPDLHARFRQDAGRHHARPAPASGRSWPRCGPATRCCSTTARCG